jgi:L-histidine N-alpha-methyltransferase
MSIQEHPHTSGGLTIDVHLNSQGHLETMADDVRRGLTSSPKYLLAKYFYDDRGSQLFEQITELPEYYPTRAERALLVSVADEVMASTQPTDLVELGSGSSSKTKLLLGAPSAAEYLQRYIPFDVSESIVRSTAASLLEDFPKLDIHGIIGDFEHHLDRIPQPLGRRLVVFLGGTIGNMNPDQRRSFLRNVRSLLSGGGSLLIGLDLVKDSDTLNAAYNDAAGVTAEFNRNILRAVNEGLQADFSPDQFLHLAFYNSEASRIEMHLAAQETQTVHLNELGLSMEIQKGETIWTESSYKFTETSVAAFLKDAGLRMEHWYVQDDSLFGMVMATPN